MRSCYARTKAVRLFSGVSLGRGSLALGMILLLLSAMTPCAMDLPRSDSLFYTNINILDGRTRWSIHVVRCPLHKSSFELRAVHAGGRAIGLGELSEQVRSAQTGVLQPVAAINGDFYQRDGAHAGDPRGLQIVDGELLSAPSGSASFWIDAADQPHVDNTASQFSVTWPDGSSSPFDLNGNREPDGIQLYTAAIGRSTRAERGRDLILEPEGNAPWGPLRPGRMFKARVRSVRDGSNSEVAPGTMVLSIGPALVREVPRVSSGASLTLSTVTSPDLRGAKTAISGGPVLLRQGKVQQPSSAFSWRGYETSSQYRRHPRSAIGWNNDFLFLVEVDGRQQRSVGMTLNELSDFLLKLGCTEGMNLDGGGSSTLWYDSRVRNSPCEGGERDIANALVIVKRQNVEPAQARAETEARP